MVGWLTPNSRASCATARPPASYICRVGRDLISGQSLRPTELLLPLGHRGRQPGPGPFADHVPLEFGERSDDGQLEAAMWGRCVDRFGKRAESDTAGR